MEAGSERYDSILKSLCGRKLTTMELEAVMESDGAHCPDDLARTLNVMRRKGFIRGAVSTERGGWVWWVEDQGK